MMGCYRQKNIFKLTGGGFVSLIVHRQKYPLWAELKGLSQRHGGMDTVFSGFIVCRGDNTPPGWISHAADDDRLSFESRIPFLFYSGKEGVHIDIKDSSLHGSDSMTGCFY